MKNTTDVPHEAGKSFETTAVVKAIRDHGEIHNKWTHFGMNDRIGILYGLYPKSIKRVKCTIVDDDVDVSYEKMHSASRDDECFMAVFADKAHEVVIMPSATMLDMCFTYGADNEKTDRDGNRKAWICKIRVEEES